MKSAGQFNVLIRVLLIVVTSMLLAFSWQFFRDPVININLVVLIVIQSYLLIRKINRIHEDLSQFFDSIRFEDTGLKIFQKTKIKQHGRLYNQLDELASQILNEKERYIQQHQYLQTITDHVGTGLISLDATGRVLLFNKSTKNILGIGNLNSLNELYDFSADLANAINNIQPGDQKVLKLYKKDDSRFMNLLLIATEFKANGRSEKLVSLSDIRNELDEKELEAWQKMIQILTHEMMNSIGPLLSTIATLKFIIAEDGKVKKPNELTDEMIADIYAGLRIIDERTVGLQGFVKGFRSLTKLPTPEFGLFEVVGLFSGIKELMSKELDANGVMLEYTVETKDSTLFADKKLIEQVLINLIKNSIEAMYHVTNPRIKLQFLIGDLNQPQIVVTDNGNGIPIDKFDEVFIPFYTTKKDGSGVGLSLSRQIMRMHGGTLTVKSDPGIETSFYLKF